MGIKFLLIHMDVARIPLPQFPFPRKVSVIPASHSLFNLIFFLVMDTLHTLKYEGVSVMYEGRYPGHAGSTMEITWTLDLQFLLCGSGAHLGDDSRGDFSALENPCSSTAVQEEPEILPGPV